MHILQLASEAVPYAKTGGLADVVGALSTHLGAAGHRVDLVLPFYREVRQAGYGDPADTIIQLDPDSGDTSAPVRLVSGPASPGLRTWFVDAPALFDRDGLYVADGRDHPDNRTRFSTLVDAGLAASEHLGFDPDVIHCHDWQTALGTVRAPAGVATVLTIHNLAYQGWFASPDDGAPRSLLALGLSAADQVTTVSPRYAREITTPAFGFGLDAQIRALDPPVLGILNGIDTTVWNPASDRWLPSSYDIDDLSGKTGARDALAEAFGIDAPAGVPVFGLVSRLVDQKGIGLFGELRQRIAGWTEARFVFLGTGAPELEGILTDLAGLPHVATRLEFSERLAHLVEAGSDFFLMPSKFEPCGLNQMISQRYGTPPIVHRTGGLADSVKQADPSSIEAGTGTGIVFEVCDAAGLGWAIQAAISLYGDGPAYRRLQENAMRVDNSWERRIEEYEACYQAVVSRLQRTTG